MSEARERCAFNRRRQWKLPETDRLLLVVAAPTLRAGLIETGGGQKGIAMNRRVALAVGLITTLAFGCASSSPQPSPATPVAANVTGSWSGLIVLSGNSYDIFYTLRQDGTKVTGNARISGLPSAALEGALSGDKFTYGLIRGRCCGEFIVKGDEMAGRGVSGDPIQLRRVK